MEKEKGSNTTPGEYLDLFNKAMRKLAMAVNQEMGKERHLIYFEQLHGYRIEEIQAAVDRAIHDEEFSVVTPVGKLIRYIEEARREGSEDLGAIQIQYREREITSERLKELLKPLYDKWGMSIEPTEEERRAQWEERKRKLKAQANLVKQTADPVEQK